MMKNRYILPLVAATLLAAGCSKEDPFHGDSDEMGQVLKSALDMSTVDNEIQVTRAESDIDLGDFKVSFIKDDNTIAQATYTYSEMPEVVTLPVGNYKATASLGENREADWENPWYYGESQAFEVLPYEITSYIDPIVCELMNIKATIMFDSSLSSVMSADSYVEVKVGDNAGLKFTATETRAGYFRHTDETTLVATFHGTINGSKVVETKSYDGIQKGRWYKLTFRLHQNGGGQGSGDIGGGVTVDASVDVDDVNADVEVADDDPMDDGERPNEGDDPDNPPTPGEAPVFHAEGDVVFDQVWNVDGSTQCKFSVTSSAAGGFTAFTCDIVSDNLTPDELAGVGLASHIDLVNPGDLATGLSSLGFPINVGGKSSVDFDLSGFMPMMAVFGNQQHKFVLTVSDANGTTVKNLILQF